MTGIYDEFLESSGRTERSGQREAFRLLAEVSDSPGSDTYAIQAPTGTGKSFAALLAGVHNFYKGRRTVIGTSTVVLSDQYSKDIQEIAEAFPDVKFAVLKGASNYFCGNKAGRELREARTQKRKEQLMGTLKLYRSGRLDYNPAWACADTDHCTDCAEKLREKGETTCEYARARAAALAADVVVTTHAMINVDARLRARAAKKSKSSGASSILGNVWLTVFDEAHKASASLIYDESFTIKNMERMDYMGVLGAAMPSYERRDRFKAVFDDVNDSAWYDPQPATAQKVLDGWPTGVELLTMMDRAKNIAEREKPMVWGWIDFMKRARDVLEEIVTGENYHQTAFWAVPKWHKDGSCTAQFKMKQMIPDSELVEIMSGQRTAWLSATIGTHSKPTYSLDKCGLFPKLFELESPFDYSTQLCWTQRTESMEITQGQLIKKINDHWDGGMVVLTPYHKRKENIASAVRWMDADVLVQEQTGNTTSNNAAVAAHVSVSEAGGKPVLVGVEIFSTGIDMPGKQLTKLVIADLFPIREDWAFIAWRSRWIESFGGESFRDYVLPERAITLEQQIGRVVRRVEDWGVVVFYLSAADSKVGSRGQQIIEEALRRFPGAMKLG